MTINIQVVEFAVKEYMNNIGLSGEVYAENGVVQFAYEDSTVFGIESTQESTIAYLIPSNKVVSLSSMRQFLLHCARFENSDSICHVGALVSDRFILLKPLKEEDLSVHGLHKIFGSMIQFNSKVN